MYSVKLEHKFTDNVSLSGFYLYNSTNEPEANFFGTADQTEPTRFADPNDYYLRRRPQILALNNTWVLSNTAVLALRFGKTEFPDNDTLTIDFDPRSLPFSTTYESQIQLNKFPQVRIRGYDQGHGARTLGAINPTEINWKSTSANATLSKIAGAHTFKFGGDWRKMGIDTFIPGDGAGFFDFDKDMTSSDGGIGSTTNGNAFASFLLGYPSARTDRVTSLSVSTPLNVFTHYFGGYAQDDWRINSKLTLTYGLRLEHEKGLSEKDNNFTVGFDPVMQSALSTVAIPADPVAGTAARTVTGGLMYAGVDGNKTYQGNTPAVKWSPRVGAVYALNDRTVLRGGYGLYWAPFNYPIPSTSASNYGQVGFSQNTILTSSRSNPTTFENPFPNGIQLPSGNSRGALTNLDSNISYVDQNRTAPRVHQFSVDLQRELPGNIGLTVSYMGARSDHIGLGGSNDIGVNINQLDPKYLALGSAALDAQLPNPFLNNPNVPQSLSTPATLSRARLLRPFPQYGQINARQVTEGLSRYHAGVIELTKRMSNGLGGRFSYTYSQLKDNQVGETNFYAAVSPGIPMNNYNYIPSMPACAAGQQFTTACYDPLAEYGLSMLDVPHRVLLSPMVELPFGDGQALGERRRRQSADWGMDNRGGDHAAEWIPDQRAAGGGFAARRRKRESAQLDGRRPRHVGQLRRSAGLGRPPVGDLAQSGGVQPGAGGNLRQRAAHDHRRPRARVVRRGRRVHQEHPIRGQQGRAIQARSAEHPEPSERAHASGREHIRQREFRPDDDTGWLLANPADDVPLQLLDLSEGLRPSDSPTRALARRFEGAIRSRGSLAMLARRAQAGRSG